MLRRMDSGVSLLKSVDSISWRGQGRKRGKIKGKLRKKEHKIKAARAGMEENRKKDMYNGVCL